MSELHQFSIEIASNNKSKQRVDLPIEIRSKKVHRNNVEFLPVEIMFKKGHRIVLFIAHRIYHIE